MFVGPVLEYSSTIWNPVYKYDIKFEAVQRRFLKRLDGLHSLSYKCRMDRLGLESLYSRRVKADLVMCHKILNNHVCVDVDSFFIRRLDYHYAGELCKTIIRLTLSRSVKVISSQTVRVINVWNSLTPLFQQPRYRLQTKVFKLLIGLMLSL